MKPRLPSPFGSGFLLIDKAQGWTSFDVVAKLRSLLQERTIGHLGTLDPLATGLLVVAVGRPATRRIQEFMKLDKDYEVELELGRTSLTYDLEGPFETSNFDLSALTLSHLEDVLASFWGTTLQMPPAFSAKKIGGQKAYALARAGKPVELQPVQVTMEALSPLEWAAPHLRFKVKVSSGTYIRSLAHDIGELVGCGGLLSGLRRTRVGPFDLSAALTLSELEALLQRGEPVPFVDPGPPSTHFASSPLLA